jgi:DNA-binding transcriptional LysR family regulator
MNYTLHQLNVFLLATQYQSITKATEELHLTQPTVSIQLKNFQDQFDIPLIEMIDRKLYVTDFGKKIANNSKKIRFGNKTSYETIYFTS